MILWEMKQEQRKVCMLKMKGKISVFSDSFSVLIFLLLHLRRLLSLLIPVFCHDRRKNSCKGTVRKQSQFLTHIFATLFMVKGGGFPLTRAMQFSCKKKTSASSHVELPALHYTLCSLTGALEQM